MSAVFALIGTSFSVSLDTFLVGMNLAYKKAHVGKMLYMSLVTAAVCGVATVLANWLDWEYQVLVGAALLISLGIYNIVSLRPDKGKRVPFSGNTYISTLTVLAFVLSLDNAGTAAMLVLMGYNAVLTTIVFGGTCLILLALGALASKAITPTACRRIFWLAGAYLIGLGVYKIFEFFL